MAILYFAKLNISNERFKIEKKEQMEEILSKLFILLNDSEHTMYKEELYHDRNLNERYLRKSSYALNIQDSNYREGYIIGDFQRDLPVYLNQKNEYGIIEPSANENFETIRFYIDFKSEIITFYITNRFGYRQFQENFQDYINEIVHMDKEGISQKELREEDEIPNYFIIRFVTTSYNLDEFRKQLSMKGNIIELSYNFIFPNMNNDLLKGISEEVLKELDKYAETEVSGVEKRFLSNTDNGLNTESILIDDFFDEIKVIKDGLELKKKTTKNQTTKVGDSTTVKSEKLDLGYMEVRAKTREGENISTQDENLYKREISDSQKSINGIKLVSIKFIESLRSLFL